MLISVIIPCYNVQAYIEACLESILQQVYQPLEIIVVDNNSTDETVATVRRIQRKYPESISLLSESQQGAPAARNRGLQAASGEWIQFMDADDLLLPEKIAHQVSQIDAAVPFIAGCPIWRQLDGSDIIVDFTKDCWKDLFESRLGYTSSNLWNKAFLDRIGGWSLSMSNCQDYDLMFRLLQQSTAIRYVDEAHSIHRDRETGQITKHNLRQNWETIVRLRLDIMAYLKKTHPDYFAHEQYYFEQMLYRLIRGLANQDIALATKYYEQYLRNSVVPFLMPSCPVPLWNIVSLRLLGFQKTEQFRAWIWQSITRFKGN